MLTEVQAQDIMARAHALQAWLGKRGSYRPEELPGHIKPPTNEEISALELFTFMRDKPERYFAYVKQPPDMLAKPGWRTCDRGALTTWTGETLGSVYFGRCYRDNLGGTRVPITVDAVNGCRYFGTYYASSGSYARLRKAKPAAV